MRTVQLWLSWVRRQLSRRTQPSKRRPSFRPGLERLERREVPANVFTWAAGADGVWDGDNSWAGPAGYPDDPSDVAKFVGTSSNKNVTMNNARTIGALIVESDYTGEIKLGSTLTISDDQLAGDSSFASAAAKIAPQNGTANLVLDGLFTMKVTKGTIGSTTNRSKIEVKGGAKLHLAPLSSITVGMDWAIRFGGDVLVDDQIPGFNGQHVHMSNDAGITIDFGGKLDLASKQGDNWILDSGGATTGIVTVEGVFQRRGTEETKIDLPVLVKDGGRLQINSPDGDTALHITSNGQPATGNTSLVVLSGGRLSMGDTQDASETGLIVADDIYIQGGEFIVTRTTATVTARYVDFRDNAELTLDSVDGSFPHLNFNLIGLNAEVKVWSGRWELEVSGNQYGFQFTRVDVQGGKLDISQTNTTLEVTMVGNPPDAGVSYGIITAEDIVGDFATFTAFGDTFDKTILQGTPDELRVTTTDP